ncbi:MAG TPA: hypothetical protein DDZ80_03670, partial [Cyanobacteria bacterium UBA8803]|nr:hypothetical protein [Cyanobacteria bacterium UBA8803]
MQPDTPPIALPALEALIYSHPLTVVPETSLVEAIALMGQGQKPCTLSCPKPRSLAVAQPNTPNSFFNKGLSNAAPGSCVLVVEGASLVGIFTAQDLLELITRGVNLREIQIHDVMKPKVVTLTLSESSNLFSALSLLAQHQILHLPVLTAEGQLVGIVTADSICRGLPPLNLLKLQRVSSVMTTPVIQAPLTTPIPHLAQILVQERATCAVLIEEEGEWDSSLITSSPIPMGLVTQEDLVRTIQLSLLGLDLSKTPAHMAIRTPLLGLSPHDSLWTALEQMGQVWPLQHLVVCEQSENLVGVLTYKDLLRSLDPMAMLSLIEESWGMGNREWGIRNEDKEEFTQSPITNHP